MSPSQYTKFEVPLLGDAFSHPKRLGSLVLSSAPYSSPALLKLNVSHGWARRQHRPHLLRGLQLSRGQARKAFDLLMALRTKTTSQLQRVTRRMGWHRGDRTSSSAFGKRKGGRHRTTAGDIGRYRSGSRRSLQKEIPTRATKTAMSPHPRLGDRLLEAEATEPYSPAGSSPCCCSR